MLTRATVQAAPKPSETPHLGRSVTHAFYNNRYREKKNIIRKSSIHDPHGLYEASQVSCLRTKCIVSKDVWVASQLKRLGISSQRGMFFALKRANPIVLRFCSENAAYTPPSLQRHFHAHATRLVAVFRAGARRRACCSSVARLTGGALLAQSTRDLLSMAAMCLSRACLSDSCLRVWRDNHRAYIDALIL